MPLFFNGYLIIFLIGNKGFLFQVVTLAGLPVEAGAPQGSIVCPLLFLIFINDIFVDINLTVRIFANDTSLYLIVDNPAEAARCMNSDLERMFQCW